MEVKVGHKNLNNFTDLYNEALVMWYGTFYHGAVCNGDFHCWTMYIFTCFVIVNNFNQFPFQRLSYSADQAKCQGKIYKDIPKLAAAEKKSWYFLFCVTLSKRAV